MSNNLWCVFDGLEVIMGPFPTQQEAFREMNIMIDECYLLDDYPHPYVAQEADDIDCFNPEDYEYVQYKHVDNNGVYYLEDMPVREATKKYYKRRVKM